MRSLIAVILLAVIGLGLALCLSDMPFGANHIATAEKAGRHYLEKAPQETGSANVVTAVVVTYRGFDTLGEVTVLFIAAIGLGMVLYRRKKQEGKPPQPASFVLQTGCCFLFPLILILGVYIFLHGHLTPGGGFQGGVIVASGFLLAYIGCADMKIRHRWFEATESLAGSAFVIAGMAGLAAGGSFLMNFMPKGNFNTLFSAGIIPIIYIAIGLKVGAELTGLIANLLERAE
ncbi:MAG: hypothetical protein JW913_14470 [Chitinispirillaceae bacterium]|nr:hypothetical protein [Chitinispirillaceae bacterium]